MDYFYYLVDKYPRASLICPIIALLVVISLIPLSYAWKDKEMGEYYDKLAESHRKRQNDEKQ